MFKLLKRIVRRPLIALGTPAVFSLESGHWRSALVGMAVDRNGAPLPWLTYPAIAFLDRLDMSQADMLEFGAGQSTLYFGQRCRSVVTLEDRPAWAAHVRKSAGGNVTVIDSPRVPQADMVVGPFNMILVDGLHRSTASEISVDLLSPDGLAIVDNATDYQGVTEPFEQDGFMRVDFIGRAPASWRQHSTAIFFKPGCRFLHHASPAAVA